MKTILSVVIILLCTSLAYAQLLPSRNMFPDLRLDSTKSSGFMTRTKFFGEMMRGFRSAGDDRAWDATIGGFANVYQWDSSAAIRVQFAQEMLGNSMNDIGFNPRSMQYEENIAVVFHAPRFNWETGLTYRCKHDIDNTDPVNSDITPLIDSNAQKRVLVLGGIYGGYDLTALAPFFLFPSMIVRVRARADLYLVHEDNRFPANSKSTSWSNVLGSVTYNIHFDLVPLSLMTVYLDAGECLFFERGSFLSQDDNNRLEAGFHFNGAVGGIDAFVSFEHLFDDLSIPEPRASNTVSVGLRVD